MRFRVSLLIFSLCFTGSVSAQNFDPKRIYQKTSKAVVLVAAFERGGKYTSSGTGSIINEDGLVLTNAHVIFNSDRNKTFGELLIFLKPDKVTGNLKKDTSRKFKASLVRYSNQLDLALLKINKNNSINRLPFLGLSNLQKISIGDPVIAIGHPEQGGLWTLTTGTISSLIENYGNIPGKDVFQTETSINKGNSGGPLIDEYGNIVGVNSMIARKGSNNTAITDINFSIQSTVAVKWMNSVGHPFSYATPKTNSEDGSDSMADNAGIVPVPKQEKITPQKKPESMVQIDPRKIIEQPPVSKEDSLKPIEKPKVAEPQILTERHPYQEKNLFRQVEDEMEDMMEEMKGSIRRH